ncbi:protein of unknown function (DUF1707) [Streptoalloteichus tenebrarius]|uniref:DUF1707 domain-containing protein n=1 Tax=Streptoalloteichus tenebrarius (strain ATCC 17920 / DSM 40477 / JCM 4838 / CBS 697.72 / NBRC 16177 / NCIMB 11028 / NRRL B-12390 / A12253. 1 / ISP 5477) TaxID=1933 RepID=A0ABT1I0X1_STRSD|nr:DUF1707 domain-containing protein [Streptoalloteichus tenebrarius]MCP2261400.1 protein of unknown function (DUF1707) [Streptoalloteichus tenebrarius]BFF02003.1 DUF1707 domain-containing protein [Streptoalloteichus tenebrarius]
MTTSAPVPPRDLRVSDAERGHVVDLLQRATGRGLLDLTEFTRRADLAMAARTRGELNAVLIDLPGLVNREVDARDTLAMEHTASSLTRRGRWVVPRRLVLRGRMGSSTLDLTEAVIPHPVVTIELSYSMSSMTLVLPPGASVDLDELTVVAGSVKDQVGAGAALGTPHVVVRGSVRAGSVVVARPRTIMRLGPLTVRHPWKVDWARD